MVGIFTVKDGGAQWAPRRYDATLHFSTLCCPSLPYPTLPDPLLPDPTLLFSPLSSLNCNLDP